MQVNVRISELRRDLIPRREAELLVPRADDGGPGVLKLLRRAAHSSGHELHGGQAEPSVAAPSVEDEWQSLSCAVTSDGEVSALCKLKPNPNARGKLSCFAHRVS